MTPRSRLGMLVARAWPLSTLAAALAVVGLTGAYAPPAAVRPNLLVNPSMEIDQVNEGAAVATNGATIVDEWKLGFVSTGHSPNAALSCQRSADAPPGFADSLECTTATGADAVGAGDYLVVQQPIEANDLVGTGLGTGDAVNVCLSWWQKSSIAGYVYSVAVQNYAQTRSYPFNIASSGTASTWTNPSYCFALDTAGSWVTSGSSGGAYLTFGLAAGSSFQGAAAGWAAGNLPGTAANTNSLLTVTGATFQITGVKLEISPFPTLFERRSFAQELALAQRYYEKSYDPGVVPGTASPLGAVGHTAATSNPVFSFRYTVSKRSTPAVTVYSTGTGASGKFLDADIATDATAVADQIGMAGFRAYPASPASGHNYFAHWVADARL